MHEEVRNEGLTREGGRSRGREGGHEVMREVMREGGHEGGHEGGRQVVACLTAGSLNCRLAVAASLSSGYYYQCTALTAWT